jgi:hypothetical protein
MGFLMDTYHYSFRQRKETYVGAKALNKFARLIQADRYSSAGSPPHTHTN